MKKISDSELSIIFQGKLYYGKSCSIDDVIKSARNLFPNAELILSTWKGEEITDDTRNILDAIILNDDPGDKTQKGKPLNINRQIVSSLSGLKLSTRKYSIKTRTDMIFRTDNILSLLSQKIQKERIYKVSENYVFVSDITTRTYLKPNRLQQFSHKSLTYMPFWVCDFLYAGLTEDVTNIFDIPLYPDEYLTGFDINNQQPHPFKFTPETYLTFNYLSKFWDVNFQFSFDNNPIASAFFEQSLIDNFMICSLNQLGVDSIKYYLPLLPPRQRLLSSKFKIIKELKVNKKKSLLLYMKYYKEYLYEYFLYKKNKKMFMVEK